MAINVYMLVTYLTDNTMFYYWSSMVIRMIPMSFFFAPVKDAPLRETDVQKMNRLQKWQYDKRQRDKFRKRKPRTRVE